MSVTLPHSSRRSRSTGLAGALLALTLLASSCGGETTPAPEESSSATENTAASDGGGDAGPSDGGGATVAVVPQDPYPVTPAPDGFEPPAPCTGEGAHLAEIGSGPSDPALPERAGETLSIELTSIDGDSAQLTAAIGNGEPRPIEDATIGETVTIDLWTISVTSVCADLDQVEFDLIN